MAELILPPMRRNEIPRVAACAAFFAVGVLMAIGGLAGAGGMVVVVIGGLCAAVFALPLLQGLHNLRSSGLRLTAIGFELNNHAVGWTDVEAFEPAGAHIRVRFVPGVEPGHGLKSSVTLGKFGLYTSPAYIPRASFDTGGAPLEDILRRWRQGDRAAERLAAPRPEAPPPRESLEIPLKLGPRIFIAIAAVGFFAVVVVGIPWTIADAENPEVWLVMVLGLIWLVITAATGYAAYAAVKALWSRGLLLTDNGFAFDGHTWAWADIEDFKTTLIRDNEGNKTMQLRAIYRQDRPIPLAPATLPFGLTDFKTDGRRIADILREWLQRYG